MTRVENESGFSSVDRFINRYSRFLPIAVLAGCVLVAALAYGGTRNFSMMMDDAFDTTWTEDRSYGQIITERFPGFGYYRPMPFLIFKATYDLTGEHNTTLLRTLLISGHAISAWLLYLLLRRLVQSEWSIAAAALFLLFPFSYQAINVIGAMGHVFVTMLLLGSLVLWFDGRSRSSPILLGISVVLSILAFWTIEYGVIGLPLLIGLELLIRKEAGEQLVTRSGLAAFGVLAVALLLFLSRWFGTDRPESDAVTIDDVARNFVFWLQIVAYPFTRFLNIIMSGDAPGYRVVLPVSLAIVSAAFAVHVFLKQAKLAAIALAVSLACFLPSLLMLTHDYVLSGPRLFYVVSPSIAAFWALLGRGVFENLTFTRVWHAAFLLFLAVTLMHSHSFIERRVEMFAVSDEVVELVVEVGDASQGQPSLIMNAPEWFSFHSLGDQEYPIGHLGAQGIPGYLGFDGLYYAVRGESAAISSGALAPDVSGWTYAWSPHGPLLDHDQVQEQLRAGHQLHVLRLADDGPYVFQPGHITTGTGNSDPQAIFDERIALREAEWDVRDDKLVTRIEWEVLAHLDEDYQIIIEAVDASEEAVLLHRDYALSGMSPPRLWRGGDVVSDRALIELPEGESVNELAIGLINTGDESHLPISDASIETRDGIRVILTR